MTHSTARKEQIQVAALETSCVGEEMKIKIFKMAGQWGIPTVFLVFAGVYWAIGMDKYYSG